MCLLERHAMVSHLVVAALLIEHAAKVSDLVIQHVHLVRILRLRCAVRLGGPFGAERQISTKAVLHHFDIKFSRHSAKLRRLLEVW